MRTIAGLCLAAAMLLTACVTAGGGSQGEAGPAGTFGNNEHAHAVRSAQSAERQQGSPSAYRATRE